MTTLAGLGHTIGLRFRSEDPQPSAPSWLQGFLSQAPAASQQPGGNYRSNSAPAGGSMYTSQYWADKVRLGSDRFRQVSNHPGTDNGSYRNILSKSGISGLEIANAVPYGWSDKQLQINMKRMSAAVGVQMKSFDDVLKVWGQAVNRAQMISFSTAGKRQLTPWDVLDLTKKETLRAGILYGGGAAGGVPKEGSMGYTKFTQTDRQIQDVTKGDAYAVLKRAASEALGRAPSADELRAFTSMANRAASENPTTTTTTSTIDNALGKTKSSSSKTKKGFGPNDLGMLGDKKADTPEAGAYQAAGMYYNALVQALESVV